MKNITALLVTAFLCTALSAQKLLPMPANLQPAYKKGTRSLTGAPGPLYWQNTGQYELDVLFNPQTRLISGTVKINYLNSSPDTLKDILFKLYPNLYKKGSVRMMKLDAEDVTEGIRIEKIEIDGKQQDPAKLNIDGTNMNVKISPLKPKQSVNFLIQYSYTLNKSSHVRQGQVDEGAFFIAYFFPRIAVYNDTDGWNRHQYVGTQEFYNDFCNFSMNITVPAGYQVWATGDLTNTRDVLNQKYYDRLLKAERSDEFITIIDSADIAANDINANNGSNTWHFEAGNVPDVAFATSNHYMWQSSSLEVDKKTKRRTRVDAVFNRAHEDYFHVISDARKTVELMSYRFPKWPFPYNHISVFDGLDQMEYPMMVNDNPVTSRLEGITLTTHEIFHTMFPFYMGTNETKYAWMDEGWATLGEWLLCPMIDSTLQDDYGVAPTEMIAGTELDFPISTVTTQIGGPAYFVNAYPKPAFGYLFAKEILGDDLFFAGLHHYFRQWNGRHPLPYDFFYSMNAGSGKNLNWFWKRWFFDNTVPDIGIAKFVNGSRQKTLTIKNVGRKPVPVHVNITYKDGSMEKIYRSAAIWEKGNTSTIISFSSAKMVASISLGSLHVPDANKQDNEWKEK